MGPRACLLQSCTNQERTKVLAEHEVFLGKLSARAVLVEMAEHHFRSTDHNPFAVTMIKALNSANRVRAHLIDAIDGGVVANALARKHVRLNHRRTNLRKHDLLFEVTRGTNKNSRCLRHALDDQRRWHHRKCFIMRIGCEVIVQMLFSQRDILHRDKSAAGFESNNSVNPHPTHAEFNPRERTGVRRRASSPRNRRDSSP